MADRQTDKKAIRQLYRQSDRQAAQYCDIFRR